MRMLYRVAAYTLVWGVVGDVLFSQLGSTAGTIGTVVCGLAGMVAGIASCDR